MHMCLIVHKIVLTMELTYYLVHIFKLLGEIVVLGWAFVHVTGPCFLSLMLWQHTFYLVSLMIHT